MKWDELDRLDNDRAVWTLPADRVKNGQEHYVYLSPQALRVLDELPSLSNAKIQSPLVFTTTGVTPISGWSRAKRNLDAAILKNMRAEAEARGDNPDLVKPMPQWNFHDLRRTMATEMGPLGVKIHVVEKILNHISGTFGGIVGVYQLDEYAEEKREGLLLWGQQVDTLLSKAKCNCSKK